MPHFNLYKHNDLELLSFVAVTHMGNRSKMIGCEDHLRNYLLCRMGH